MRKILALLMVFAMTFTMVACGGDKEDADNDGQQAQETQQLEDQDDSKDSQDSDHDEDADQTGESVKDKVEDLGEGPEALNFTGVWLVVRANVAGQEYASKQ